MQWQALLARCRPSAVVAPDPILEGRQGCFKGVFVACIRPASPLLLCGDKRCKVRQFIGGPGGPGLARLNKPKAGHSAPGPASNVNPDARNEWDTLRIAIRLDCRRCESLGLLHRVAS